jgi:cytohesin
MKFRHAYGSFFRDEHNMKTKMLLAVILLAPAALLSAATNDLTPLLQQGLLDEEAGHDLPAAITEYQSLAAQFDKDREIAATAIYRLGECYRKLGQTNQAAAQYQRIVREFADQKTLATLSQQDLTGMGMRAAAPPADAARQKEQDLLADETKVVEQELQMVQVQSKAGVADYKDVLATQQKLFELKRQLAALEAGLTVSPSAVSATDEEDQKIREIKALVQNSPDLINSELMTQVTTSDNLRVTQYLLDNNANVNLRMGNGDTPLIAAAARGKKAMVELLLAHGANVNAPGNFDETALHKAAGQGFPAVAEVLLANHADVNALSNDGRTPLSFAAVKDSPEMIKLLLAAKADPNAGRLDAPLLCVIEKKDIASADLLLQAGANANAAGPIDVSTGQGNMIPDQFIGQRLPITPLWLAIYMKQLPMVKLLLQYKADPNGAQADGRPLLFSALSSPDILEALLDAGAKVEAIEVRPQYGYSTALGNPPTWTALAAAAYQNAAAAVEILLKHGANANARNPANITPLHCAALSLTDSKVFELLLADKADPNVRNNQGKTPLDLLKDIAGQNYTGEKKALAVELADVLRRHGALDNLPDLDLISVSRPSANYSSDIFRKGTNDWNHFTLLEVVAAQCQFLAASPDETGSRYDASAFWPSLALPFPDLAHLRIRRPASDLKSWKEQTVDLASGLKSGDGSNDVTVEWGDVVEIPEAEHPLNERWPGFSISELTNLKQYLTRHLVLIVKGQTNAITLEPEIKIPAAKDANRNSVEIDPKTSFWLKPVLLQSKEILTSCDLSHVKVSRRDAKTGQTRQWILDCSNPPPPSNGFGSHPRDIPPPFGPGGGGQSVRIHASPLSDLWLRDGDVIEVPEK